KQFVPRRPCLTGGAARVSNLDPTVTIRRSLIVLSIASLAWSQRASAQTDTSVIVRSLDSALSQVRSTRLPPIPTVTYSFRSRADSLEWIRSRELAERSHEYRIVVSLQDRQLWVVTSAVDTLLSAPVAVASGLTLDYAGRTWTFRTPRGKHTVLRKES